MITINKKIKKLLNLTENELMRFKQRKEQKLILLREQKILKDQLECTFNPTINHNSSKIVGQYNLHFKNKTELKKRTSPKETRSKSNQNNFQAANKKSYHRIHNNREYLRRKASQKTPKAAKVNSNSYLLGFDRNQRGSVFDHLYMQRNIQEYKKMKLFNRVQQEECPFKPKFENKQNVKPSVANFLKRNEIFLRKKEKTLAKEEYRIRQEMFRPNLSKKSKAPARTNVHEILYNYREKENFKKQRLIERFEVWTLFEVLGWEIEILGIFIIRKEIKIREIREI